MPEKEAVEETTPRRRPRWRRPAIGMGILVVLLLGGLAFFAGCTSWDPRRPFERNAPEVDAAIAAMEAGEPQRASDLLQEYLQTGPCSEEGIGLPDAVRDKYNASFDFGLALFQLAESYGHRFGEEPMPAPSASGLPMAPPSGDPPDEEKNGKREQTIACALAIVNAIGSDPEIPIDLRARAFYLAGNLDFMQEKYEEAVKSYDLALALMPGFPEPKEGEEQKGPPKDTIGADAAWNRSIALWRQQEIEAQQPPPPEPQPDDENQSQDKPEDGDKQDDGGDDDKGDQGEKGDKGDEGDKKDGEDEKDEKKPDEGDEGDEQEQDKPEPDPSGDEEQADKGANEGIDESGEEEGAQASLEALLDQFESAPTYQEEAAKKRGNNVRRRRVMEDK